MMMGPRWIATVAVGAALAAATPVAAQVSGVTLTGGSLSTNYPFTLGYNFTVSQARTVIGLGAYDAGANGLAESHAVGLWNNGTLVASATVPSGTTGTLLDSFRYATLNTPYTLTVGQSYTVGALYGSTADQWGYDANITSAPGITYTADRYIGGPSLTNPTNSNGLPATGAGYFGGNILLAAAAPEPGTWLLMIVGFGIVGGTLRRQKRARVRVRFATT